MRFSKLGFLITVLIFLIAIITSSSADEKSEFINYDYKDLLGETKSKLISQLGEKYEITTQGVDNQNTGLKYKYLGVLIGVDEISDKVVEVQILDGEYLGVSTKMSIDEAVEIMSVKESENLILNLDSIGTWYIYDFEDFRVRLSEESNSNNKVQIFITLEEYK